jgi:hypothetical protein
MRELYSTVAGRIIEEERTGPYIQYSEQRGNHCKRMSREERMKRRRWKITKIFVGKRATQKNEKKL